MTVMFCGHSDTIPTESLRSKTKEVSEALISRGATEFLLGGYGAFDNLAAGVLQELKKQHPNITTVLVLAYLDQPLRKTDYDSILYPPLEAVPRKFAISHRNRWMVKTADVVVAYVNYDWGGAATTLRQAVAQKKEIIQLGKHKI